MSSVRLGSNIASLTAQRRLSESTAALGSIYERLSSGQRINRASDDAAGLAVASSLQNNRRVLTQGIRNYNDGISLLNVADGAAEQLSGITIRLKELAEQAANGTYGVKQRQSLDAEAQALSKEYFRIARSTNFNGRGVFFSEFGELRLQGGYGLDGGIQSGLGGAIGTGTFVSSGSNTIGATASEMVAGDFNGDGLTDLVSADTGDDTVSLLLGNGDGTFRSRTVFSVGNNPTSIINGDFNGDGKLDIATSNSLDGNISILIGSGTGSFSAATSYTVAAGTRALVSSDFNGDGIADIAAVNNGTAVHVLLGNSSGTFAAPVTYSTGGSSVTDVTAGDLNGDGIIDLATANPASQSVSVLLGRGDGTFQAASTISTGSFPLFVSMADFNNDSRMDLVAGSTSGVLSIYLGSATGTISLSQSISTGDFDSAAFGDFNGDGNQDIAVNSSAASVQIYSGAGNGTFTQTASYTIGATLSFATTSDFNGDGVTDVGLTSTGGTAYILSGASANGIGPLQPFSLSTQADSLQALSQFDQALNRLSTQRGIIGAFQSRITVAGNTLQASADNYAAAAGRIKDADVAQESAKLIRTQILQQAASSVLAQANQQPALALQLLGDV